MKTIDRVLSFLLALVMVLSLSPAPAALAEEPEGTIAPVSEPAPEPSDSAGDGAFDVSPAEPAAEPVADEPQDSHAFTTQPQDGTVVPDGSLTFTWGTNFSPVRVEIVRDDYHYDLTGEWHEYIVLASLAGSKTSHTMGYDELRVLDSSDTILVRAYYGSGEQNYAESRAVKVTVVAREFTVQPTGGTVAPRGTLSFTWATNFSPVKVEIVRNDTTYYLGGEDHEYTVLATLAGSKTSHTMSYDELSILDSEDTLVVRAYYSSTSFVTSSPVDITLVSRAFTVQPTGGHVEPGGTLSFTWETNFDRVKVEIVRDDATYYFGGEEHEYIVLTTLAGSKTSHTMSYDELSALDSEDTIRVRAYYDSDSFVRSDPIEVTLTSRQFTLQPTGGNVEPDSTLTTTWDTNFSPVRIEIVLEEKVYSSGNMTYEYTVLATLSGSAKSYPLTYEQILRGSGSGRIVVRAYYANRDGAFVRSDPVSATSTSRAFTAQPTGGDVPAGASLTTTWATNFLPLKVEIVRARLADFYGHYDYTVLATLDGGETSYSLPYVVLDALWENDLILVRAYYGTAVNHYVESDPVPFTLGADNISGYCGFMHLEDASWVFVDGVLTISGEGYMRMYLSADEVPWRYLADNIHTVVVEEGINGVSPYAFSSCANLTTVYLPSTLTEIEDYAFDNCPALTDAHINMSLQQFSAVTWDKTKNTGLRDAEKHFTFIAEGQAGPSLTWKLANDGVLSFSGSGAMYNWTSSDPAPWYPYRSRITQVRLVNVTTVGDYAFRGCSKLSSASFPSELTYLGVRAFGSCSSLAAVYWAAPNSTNVTEIPEACFSGCTALQSFTVPKKCAVIGQGAFSGCDALTTVSFPEGSALTTVGKRAFYSCDNLGNISLPEGVTSLGDEAFYNCKSLTSFPLPSTLTSLGASCFSGCSAVTGVVTIPDGVAEIPNHCFYGCSGFYKLALSPGTNQIGRYAFYGCSKLTQVDYDGFRVQWEQVAVSNNNAPLTGAQFSWLYRYGTLSNGTVNWALFGATGKLVISGTGSMPTWVNAQSAPWYQYAPYIQVIDVHTSVEKIGAFAFRNCSALTTLYLPGTITSVGYFAFNESTALADVWYDGPEVDWEKVSIDNGNIPLLNARKHFTELGGVVDGTDLYWTLDDNGVLTVFHDPDNLDWGEMAVPDFQDPRMAPWYPYRDRIHAIHVQENVTGIGGGAFNDIPDLREVEISDSVTEIGDYVFDGCGGAFSVTIPDSVTVMWTRAFQNCTGLNAATVGSGVTAIPYGTFSNCGSLETVTIPATVTGIAENAFYNCSGLQDVYFAGTYAQWKAITKGSGNDALNTATIHFVPPEIKVDAINFPDAKFRAYVAENIDTDGSGWLTDAECRAVTRIDCQSQSIASLQGLAFFPRLGVLICSDNNLDKLDLSANPILMNLNCNGNPLVELDLSANPLLTSVECVNCSLTELDLSGNAALWQLYCSDNALTVLDLSGNPRLGYLDCAGNRLATLDLSPCTGLQKVYCQNNGMTALTLGRQEALQQLACYGNSLASVDLTESTLLKNAVLNGTRTAYNTSFGNFVEFRSEDDYVRADPSTVLMTTPDGIPVDAVHFPDASFRSYVAATLDPNGDLWLTPAEIAAVTEIVCQEMHISSLTGMEYFPNLEILMCGSNDLTALDLSGNTKLVELDCSENDLSALNVSGLSDLEILNVNGNAALSGLDLSANTALEELSVQACGLSALNLSSNVNLWYLDCSDNNLSALNLSGNPDLKELYCDNNELTSLDLSHNPALYYVSCFKNAITSLDVSTNTALKELYCDNNVLTSLTLGDLPALKELYCYHNNLTSLDLRGCPLILDMVLTEEATTYEDWVYYTKTTAEGVFYEFDVDPDVVLITTATVYTMAGFEASATGISYYDSFNEYWLDGKVQTPVWKDGIAPDFGAIQRYIIGLTLDEACTQKVTEEPELGDVFYVRYSIFLTDLGQGVVDFSELSTSNCTLTLPGYETSCINVKTVVSEGKDVGIVKFKIYKLLPIDEVNFPDPTFRAYVAEHCDTSGNGWLNEAEINAVHEINVSGLGIETLQGIQYFTSLQELVCYNNSLTELDLEGLSLLHYLDAHGNPFTTLDLSPYPSLTMVELCGTPSLTSLNVAGLTQLGYLDVSSCGLTALDLSSCRSLYFLDCCGCEALESLILGESETMEDLYAYHTPALTQLDLSGCPKLAAAWLDGPDKVEDGIAWYYGAAGLPCEMALDPDQAVITQAYLPGDINGDGELNNKDVTSLIRYLKYRDITVVEAALDVNGDGDMNNKDVTTLIRYLKYHDVVIH